MNFSKIKYNGTMVTLRWSTDAGKGDEVKYELESIDPPRPELGKALDAFVPDVLKLLELPEEYATEMRVVGLSISRSADERLGLVVTCLKKIAGANAPVVINTPHLMEPGDDDQPSLPPAMLRLLDTAIEEAEMFVKGQRAQTDLFAA